MNTKILEKIGMTNGEVRVYLALLDLGISSTGKIIDNSHITSSKVYLILERLEQKGLVSHVIKNNIKYFQATNPKRILDYVEEKKKELDNETNEIKKILPELEAKRKSNQELYETMMYHGYKGIESAMFKFIEGLNKGDEYVVLGSSEILEKNHETMVRKFYINKANKGIKTRLIYNVKQKSVIDIYKGIKLTEVKFVNNITPSTVAVSNKKVLIITYGEESKAVLIQSRQIAKSFYNFFESLWNIAKQ